MSNISDDNAGPACISCRKRKRKCSRGSPCENCVSIGSNCVYEEFKKRGCHPGISLVERVDRLENMMVGQAMLLGTFDRSTGSSRWTGQESPTKLFAEVSSNFERHGKRIRDSTDLLFNATARSSSNGLDEPTSNLPPEDVIKKILPIYFDQIHPWIPILHRPTFTELVLNNSKAYRLVLQAIVAVTIKFLPIDTAIQDHYYKVCRESVLLACLDRFSTESLQASVILAFDTVGCGKGPRSWSIISSATRIVEHLGLSMEEDDITSEGLLLNRIGFLKPSTSAAEREARRRIFWSIFLMDRFCSVTTGWNISLNGDIKRRLPMEGEYFSLNFDRKAKYFGSSEDVNSGEDTLGGYAYLIEATELLSKVVSFLLYEKDTSMKEWSSNFQRLDSMLIKWKSSLPAKFQTLRVSPRGMDENLTLAHITYNTSVTLLHHNLAYPPAGLHAKSQQKSVQICINAALEIQTITTHFLVHVKRVVSPQYCFCLFIAARTILANQVRGQYNEDTEKIFARLVEQLNALATRWTASSEKTDNFASMLADRLKKAKRSHSEIDARKTVFSDDDDEDKDSLSLPMSQSPGQFLSYSLPTMADSNNIAVLIPVKPGAYEGPAPPQGQGQTPPSSLYEEFDYSFLDEKGMDYIFSWGDEDFEAIS